MALTTAKTVAPEATNEEETLTQEGTAAVANAEPEEVQEAPAQEAAPAEEAPVKTESTAVATREAESTAVAKSNTGGGLAVSEMAEDGMEGLTVGGMSFDTIKLPGEGQFLIGQDDEELGKSFKCVIQASRARFVVRQSNDQDAEMFYSYDADTFAKTGVITNTEGVDQSDTIAEWKEDGYDEAPVIKKYVEVMAIMIDEDEDGNPGERHGMMVMLSIPPASVQRFSGFIYQQRMMKRLKQNQFVTECIVGKKVKKDSNSFFPWAFKNAGAIPEDLEDLLG